MSVNAQRDISTRHGSNTRITLSGSQMTPTNDGVSPAVYANLQDITSMDAFLAANGYTQLTLDRMLKNDKLYAIRLKVATIAP